MFENVVAMRVNDKRDISRFLEVREHRGRTLHAGQGRAAPSPHNIPVAHPLHPHTPMGAEDVR